MTKTDDLKQFIWNTLPSSIKKINKPIKYLKTNHYYNWQSLGHNVNSKNYNQKLIKDFSNTNANHVIQLTIIQLNVDYFKQISN